VEGNKVDNSTNPKEGNPKNDNKVVVKPKDYAKVGNPKDAKADNPKGRCK